MPWSEPVSRRGVLAACRTRRPRRRERRLHHRVDVLSFQRCSRVVVLDQADPPSVVCVNWVGKEFPLHTCSPGKLLLARLPPEELDRLLASPFERLTRKTITSSEELRAELERVRRARVAVNDEEFQDGCVGVSAEVEDSAGGLVAIVSATGPSYRMPARRQPMLRSTVREASLGIAASLGYVRDADREGSDAAREGDPRASSRLMSMDRLELEANTTMS